MEPAGRDLADGFALTGFFLARHVLERAGRRLTDERAHFIGGAHPRIGRREQIQSIKKTGPAFGRTGFINISDRRLAAADAPSGKPGGPCDAAAVVTERQVAAAVLDLYRSGVGVGALSKPAPSVSADAPV